MVVAGDLPDSTVGGPCAPTHAAYLTHPQCTGAHHQAGQMPQLTFWVFSESPPGKTTKVRDARKVNLLARGSGGDRVEGEPSKPIPGGFMNPSACDAWLGCP
jgi:hypothetical protein